MQEWIIGKAILVLSFVYARVLIQHPHTSNSEFGEDEIKMNKLNHKEFEASEWLLNIRWKRN